jgi:hypothetical protein
MFDAVTCPNVTLLVPVNATPPPFSSWAELDTMLTGVKPEVPLEPLVPFVPLVPLVPPVPLEPVPPDVPDVPDVPEFPAVIVVWT